MVCLPLLHAALLQLFSRPSLAFFPVIFTQLIWIEMPQRSQNIFDSDHLPQVLLTWCTIKLSFTPNWLLCDVQGGPLWISLSWLFTFFWNVQICVVTYGIQFLCQKLAALTAVLKRRQEASTFLTGDEVLVLFVWSKMTLQRHLSSNSSPCTLSFRRNNSLLRSVLLFEMGHLAYWIHPSWARGVDGHRR